MLLLLLLLLLLLPLLLLLLLLLLLILLMLLLLLLLLLLLVIMLLPVLGQSSGVPSAFGRHLHFIFMFNIIFILVLIFHLHSKEALPRTLSPKPPHRTGLRANGSTSVGQPRGRTEAPNLHDDRRGRFDESSNVLTLAPITYVSVSRKRSDETFGDSKRLHVTNNRVGE